MPKRECIYRRFLPAKKITLGNREEPCLPPHYIVQQYLRDAKLHSDVIDHSPGKRRKRVLSHADYILLMTIIMRLKPSEKGYSCFPSIRRLAAETGLSLAQIDASKKHLREEFLLDWKRRYNGSNIWYVNVELLQELAKRRNERGRHGSSKSEAEGEVDFVESDQEEDDFAA